MAGSNLMFKDTFFFPFDSYFLLSQNEMVLYLPETYSEPQALIKWNMFIWT